MKKLNCPVVSTTRLKTLLFNSITFLNTEYIQFLSTEEKLDILKEEIGFTDEEIEKLNIVKECGLDDNDFKLQSNR